MKGVRHHCSMSGGATALTTSRLRLVPATGAIIDAELGGHEGLAKGALRDRSA
jgi:hypothetical protein